MQVPSLASLLRCFTSFRVERSRTLPQEKKHGISICWVNPQYVTQGGGACMAKISALPLDFCLLPEAKRSLRTLVSSTYPHITVFIQLRPMGHGGQTQISPTQTRLLSSFRRSRICFSAFLPERQKQNNPINPVNPVE